jgi:LysM repeat protein
VRTGNGEVIVVPSNITEMTPPRQIQVYEAQIGDTLASIAERNTVDLALLQADNPILAQRGLHPGDTVFIGFRIFNR